MKKVTSWQVVVCSNNVSIMHCFWDIITFIVYVTACDHHQSFSFDITVEITDQQTPLSLCPSCLCSYHFFSLCQLTTLTIHNSFSLSLPAQDLPLPQIFPSIDSLPASGLTPRTSRLDRFFWASLFYVFSFFIILYCLVPCGSLSWLLVSFWVLINIVHHIISYISKGIRVRKKGYK